MALDVAILSFAVDTSDLVKGEKALGSVATAGGKAEVAINLSMKSIESALASVAKSTDANSKALSDLAKSMSATKSPAEEIANAYERLRTSIDPIYASSKKYEAAVETLDKELQAGQITATQYAATLEMAGKRFLSITPQAAKLNGAVKDVGTGFQRVGQDGFNLGQRIHGVGMQIGQGGRCNPDQHELDACQRVVFSGHAIPRGRPSQSHGMWTVYSAVYGQRLHHNTNL